MTDGPAQQWLMEFQTTMAFLNAVLSIVHPELYAAGEKVMRHLREDDEIEDVHEILDHWMSVFTTVSAVVNRESPLHRDPKTCKSWYDMMLTVGQYQEAILELSTFSVCLLYNAGTVICISGKLVHHGVSEIESGDRIVYSFYMRESVHRFCSVPLATWMHYSRWS
ncbi:hypothetical protein HYDPIDRAFT_98419 [Hydnomerulius pinastri MD-312]|uniref:2OGFeDO JBP1/TET oxygenase domain-containing protein n=1 Tax=Hydnomerulius pinastri MD-312 TaxID=994086 RepID=A0A0C9WBC8_9AGAM|nr:hypothetical protein HYDPIDRAFT_98419 [Hydnomerulius pinastri MD-312]